MSNRSNRKVNAASVIGLAAFAFLIAALWPRLAGPNDLTFFSSVISPLPTPTTLPPPTTTGTPEVRIQQCPEMNWVETAPGFWVIFYWNGQEWVEADPVADAWIFEDCDLPPRSTPTAPPTASLTPTTRAQGDDAPTSRPEGPPASQAPTDTPTPEPSPAVLPVTGAE